MTLALIDVLADPSDAPAGCRAAAFDRPDPLVEVDLAIWDADGPAARYPHAAPVDPWPLVLTAAASNRLVRDARSWARAFEGLIGRGGTLVVLAPRIAAIGLHTLQEIVGFGFTEPLRGICPLTSYARPAGAPRGRPMAVAGEPFATFFAAHGDAFDAALAFDAPSALTIAVDAIAGERGGREGAPTCALYRAVHPGRVLVLPSPAAGVRTDAMRMAGLVEGIAALVDRLRRHALASTTRRGAGEASPEQRALRDAIEAIDREARALAERRARLAVELDATIVLEQLLVGDRGAAIHAAALVLHGLGAYVQQGVDANALMFESGSGIGLLIAIDAGTKDGLDDPCRLAPDLFEVASGWARPFGGEPAVRFLCAGECAPDDARVVTGADLLAAHRAGDASLLERLLER